MGRKGQFSNSYNTKYPITYDGENFHFLYLSEVWIQHLHKLKHVTSWKSLQSCVFLISYLNTKVIGKDQRKQLSFTLWTCNFFFLHVLYSFFPWWGGFYMFNKKRYITCKILSDFNYIWLSVASKLSHLFDTLWLSLTFDFIATEIHGNISINCLK